MVTKNNKKRKIQKLPFIEDHLCMFKTLWYSECPEKKKFSQNSHNLISCLLLIPFHREQIEHKQM